MRDSGRSLRRLLGLAACAVALAANPLRADAASDHPPSSGAALYERHCSSCHGADGTGRTPLSMLLRTPPPDLTLIAARRDGWFPDGVIRQILDGRMPAHGARDMPVWGRVLSHEELVAITDHLRSMQQKTAASRK
ncbi:MAG: cytochrome c [Deltaproteobacteria bacterium]|nr:cytochrome c [Deltaproteobacteria bacterium]MBW2360927.1 cytochrome c [Deltaproteobacteria bacterium]